MNWLDVEEVAGWIRSPGKAQLSPKGFPMFQTQNVKLTSKSEAEISGRGDILLAENIDTIWYVETKARKSRLLPQDAKRFLQMKEELKSQNPDLYIRGILLTSAPFSDDLKDAFEQEECLLIAVPEEKKKN